MALDDFLSVEDGQWRDPTTGRFESGAVPPDYGIDSDD